MINSYSLAYFSGMDSVIKRLQDISSGEVYLVATDDKLVDCQQVRASEYGEDRNLYRAYHYPIVLIPNCCYGDYYGGSSERSNHRLMLEKYGEMPGITEIIGSYGYSDLAINPLILVEKNRELLDELLESIAYLSEYSVLDEDDLSAYETEQESEDWVSYGKSDFIRHISAQFGSAFADLLETSKESCLASIYSGVCEANNDYPHFEESSTYFPFPDNMDIQTILESEWMKLDKSTHKYLVTEEGEPLEEKTIYLITENGFDNADLVASQLRYEIDADYSLVFNGTNFELFGDGELIAAFEQVNPDQLALAI